MFWKQIEISIGASKDKATTEQTGKSSESSTNGLERFSEFSEKEEHPLS